MLRSPSASFKWEQKVVGQTLKTLFVNAFLAYRMSERPELLENPCSFQNVNLYRQNLNNMESLSEYCFEACTELLRFADTLRQSDQSVEESPAVVVNDSEITQLCELARKRKRNRLAFFNSVEGVRLRLHVHGHSQKQMLAEHWCALCRMNVKNGSSYRGHRSSFKCTQCETHLCVRKYHGMRRSCWDMWHANKRLEQRDMEGRRSVSRGRSACLSEISDSVGESFTSPRPRRGQKRLSDDSTRPHTRSVRSRLSSDMHRGS